MSDDLVIKLRTYFGSPLLPVSHQAANEIERLNAENARLRADAVALQSVMERMREWESLVLRDRATVRAENARLREILATIVMHYPQGINPWLDDACNAARAALAEKEK